MKRKLKDKMVQVQVLVQALIYSLDGLTDLIANTGDLITIPSWMATGLEGKELVKSDIDEDLLLTESEEEGDVVPDGDAPLTVAELKELTELDFEELETTADFIQWAGEQEALNGLVIHPACKPETSMTKVLEAIAALEDED